MGAESSSLLASVNIDSSPILTTQDWSLHHAQRREGDEGQLSVFIDNEFRKGGRVELLAKNLAQHRHPAILRHIAWLPGSSKAHLFTEKASPLSVVRRQQTDQALCLGLQDLLQALQFLHDVAGCSHGALCLGSIFVTPHGRWRLAGVESLQRFKLEEQERAKDVQAAGLLVTQLLSESTDKEATTFREFARAQMLLPDVSRLPSLATVLAQPYFQQSYLTVVTFLRDLPLHTPTEREAFLLSLPDLLRQLPPSVVGLQLTPLLLGRFVLMDPIAREKLLPHLLCPKQLPGSELPCGNLQPILPLEEFQEHVVPQLRTMFLVPDTQVRLTLLRHFPNYCRAVDRDTLVDDILPALLLGLKDTNSHLVAATLRALADLVPILGPEVVVGSNRTKIFSDGSPGKAKPEGGQGGGQVVGGLGLGLVQHAPPTPPALFVPREDTSFDWHDNWEDDEEDEDRDKDTVKDDLVQKSGIVDIDDDPGMEPTDTFAVRSSLLTSNVEKMIKNVGDLDIMKLDVKVSKLKTDKVEDVDFFADMKPDIPKAASALEQFEEKLKINESPKKHSLLVSDSALCVEEADVGEGAWGEAGLDWGGEDDF